MRAPATGFNPKGFFFLKTGSADVWHPFDDHFVVSLNADGPK
jgi:hypothetical protein